MATRQKSYNHLWQTRLQLEFCRSPRLPPPPSPVNPPILVYTIIDKVIVPSWFLHEYEVSYYTTELWSFCCSKALGAQCYMLHCWYMFHRYSVLIRSMMAHWHAVRRSDSDRWVGHFEGSLGHFRLSPHCVRSAWPNLASHHSSVQFLLIHSFHAMRINTCISLYVIYILLLIWYVINK